MLVGVEMAKIRRDTQTDGQTDRHEKRVLRNVAAPSLRSYRWKDVAQKSFGMMFFESYCSRVTDLGAQPTGSAKADQLRAEIPGVCGLRSDIKTSQSVSFRSTYTTLLNFSRRRQLDK